MAPNTLLTQEVGVSAFPQGVELQWPGVADDPAGVGVMWYEIYPNGAFELAFCSCRRSPAC